ncbi:MAG: hypothetical protein ACFB2Z_02780 [Maricaulaceae bacterium]
MLFLFNDRLLDLGLPKERLRRDGSPLSHLEARLMAPQMFHTFVAQTLIDVGDFAEPDMEKLLDVCSVITIRSDANAILAAKAPKATKPNQVAVRYADVSLLVLSNIKQLQQTGRLTPQAVDDMVWRRVAA